MVLLSALVALGLSGVIMAAYFTVLQSELNASLRAAARVQALYLAESGLDAAHDQLAQDWSRLQAGPLRLREALVASAALGGRPLGEFEVVATPLTDRHVRLVSVGRTVPMAAGADGVRYGIERCLVAVVVARIRPTFSRMGGFGTLQSSTEYGPDGLPAVVAFTGRFEPEPGWRGPGLLVTSGAGAAPMMGPDVVAGFHDIDGDGDRDLLLGAIAPDAKLSAHSSPPELDAQRAMTATPVDVLGTGAVIPVVTTGWMPLPEDWLTRPGPGFDIFVNALALDGTSLVSWSEVQSDQAAALWAGAEPNRSAPTAGGRHGAG
jgi:hypothetical protein